MKGTKLLTLSVIVWILAISAVSAVLAGNSLGSGYAVTSNWHGQNVPPGAEVTVTAMTTDADVDQVTFLWKDPDGNTVIGPEVDNTPTADGTYEGKTIYTFTSTHNPDVYGDWGVQALFQDLSDGKTKEQVDYVVSIKATSFFVVPELATILLALAPFGAFGLYAYKRKKL